MEPAVESEGAGVAGAEVGGVADRRSAPVDGNQPAIGMTREEATCGAYVATRHQAGERDHERHGPRRDGGDHGHGDGPRDAEERAEVGQDEADEGDQGAEPVVAVRLV